MKALLIIFAVAIFANYAHSLPYSINEKYRGFKNKVYTFKNKPCRTNKHGFKKCNLYYSQDYELKAFQLSKETSDFEAEKKSLKEYITQNYENAFSYQIKLETKGKMKYLILDVWVGAYFLRFNR